MKSNFDRRLVLYYSFLPALALVVVGAILFRWKTPAATAGEVVIAVLLGLAGATMTFDIRGYGSFAIAYYKREPLAPMARNMPRFALRYALGVCFIGVSLVYLVQVVSSLT
jgi:hypothetical protein